MGVKRKEIDILLNITEVPLSVRELSEKLGDSERNLRYSVENLEYYLKKLTGREVVKKNKKLSASLTKREVDGFLCSLEGEYIYSNDERREYILNTFLFGADPKLTNMEEELDVSRTTLKKDMTVLQDELEEYGLYFDQRGNRVFIGGNEKKLRHLTMLKMIKYLDASEGALYPVEKKIGEMIRGRRRGLKKRAEELLDRIEAELQEEFSGEFKRIMKHYLWVTLFRIEEGRYIVKKHNSDFLRKTSQYKKVERIMRKYIGEGLEYEVLHLTEYFLSGSSKREYYEERLAIELFTLGLLRVVERRVAEEIFNEELFRKITGYLTSALYRMKNNFVLTSGERFTSEGEVGEAVFDVCTGDTLLTERLRGEEMSYIERVIKNQLQENNDKFIELRKIMDIVKRSAEGVDEEKLSKELLREYGRWIIPSERSEMAGLEELLLKERIEGEDIEDILEEGSRSFAEKGMLRERVDLSKYIKANIFKEPEILCYYIGDEDLVVRSGIAITPVKDGEEVVIILALGGETTYLDALLELQKIVDEGLVKTLIKH